MRLKDWILPTNLSTLYLAAKRVYPDLFHARMAFLFSITMLALPVFFIVSDESVNAQSRCPQLGCQTDNSLVGFALLTPLPIFGYAYYKQRLEKPWMLKRMRGKLWKELLSK